MNNENMKELTGAIAWVMVIAFFFSVLAFFFAAGIAAVDPGGWAAWRVGMLFGLIAAAVAVAIGFLVALGEVFGW